jgi:hypothetical protein
VDFSALSGNLTSTDQLWLWGQVTLWDPTNGRPQRERGHSPIHAPDGNQG